MLQTIAHRDAPAGLLDQYGLVVVDECHALGAEAAIGKVAAGSYAATSTPRATASSDLFLAGLMRLADASEGRAA